MARIAPKHPSRLSHATSENLKIPWRNLNSRANTDHERTTASAGVAGLKNGQHSPRASLTQNLRGKGFEKVKAQRKELAGIKGQLQEDLEKVAQQLDSAERQMESVQLENEGLRAFLCEVLGETRALERRIWELIVLYSCMPGKGKPSFVQKKYGLHKEPESHTADSPDLVLSEARAEEGPNRSSLARRLKTRSPHRM
ncbi:hypothetical protein N7490_006319 [Penicillium lividum]|nr:hypothetical protein N7490_006319 [Penicillium lividum]